MSGIGFAARATAVFLGLLSVPVVPVILTFGSTAPAWLIVPLMAWGFLSAGVALLGAALMEDA